MENINKKELEDCKKNINDFYKLYNDIYNEVTLWSDMEEDEIENLPNFKKNVESCINKYYKKFDKDLIEIIEKLKNVGPDTKNRQLSKKGINLRKYFQVYLSVNENSDIYNKTKLMDFEKTLKKVLKEYSEKKECLNVENKIINNRLKFVFDTNKKNQDICLKELSEEKHNLINFGYDKKIIKELYMNYITMIDKDIRNT